MENTRKTNRKKVMVSRHMSVRADKAAAGHVATTKRLGSILLALTLLLGTVLGTNLASAKPAEAASTDVTKLSVGTTYSYDLNGDGKSEKIRVNYTSGNDAGMYYQTVVLNINGNPYYMDCNYDDPHTVKPKAYRLDVTTKDKYKEIALVWLGKVAVIRYVSSSNVRVYTSDYLGCIEGVNGEKVITGNTGKNKFYVLTDTPRCAGSFGSYVAKMPVKLSGSYVVPVSTNTFKVNNTAVKKLNKQMTGTEYYKLIKSKRLYASPSSSATYKTLKSGTSFLPTAVRRTSTLRNGTIWVKIKTRSGRTGWMKFLDDWSKNELKWKPNWQWV